ncbi:MAG: mRNA surveillance protein pelota [Candidatus Micrarchaeales archaeon]|nr:mRNA surveillance protein pelota [Candidatus Micrarchaeales archaeon]
MKVLKFYEGEGKLKLRVDTLDDLWTLQRIIFENDFVKSESLRKFKSSESDKGEMKEVVIKVRVEKTEFDKTANRLRIMGKIVEGRPLEFIKLNSYHTLNIGPEDVLEIQKESWPDYIVNVVRTAVSDTKKARLGLIVVDDEKALPAYLLGYGVEFRNEIYSRLSKRMSQKDFAEQQKKYFQQILDMADEMRVDTVIIAGPGFTKDDIKKQGEETGFLKKSAKRIIFEAVSNAERSGIYELIKGEKVAALLQRERIRMEFKLMEDFLNNLSTGKSKSGVKDVGEAIENYEANVIMVNDLVLSKPEVQKVLASAEEKRIKIEVFNANDEVGQQLHGFDDIACVA